MLKGTAAAGKTDQQSAGEKVVDYVYKGSFIDMLNEYEARNIYI